MESTTPAPPTPEPADAVVEPTETAPAAALPEATAAEVAVDKQLSDDELLADMPALKDPHKLRIAQKNRLMGIVLQSDALESSSDDAKPKKKGERDRAETLAILELVAAIDDFAESIAVDKDAYVEWAEGKDYPVFLAILGRYSVALGK